ncbi:hypothetical protein HY622_03575 [Candidatus Uhrbacteria bacterium]|nr:hypothetical protein [Candidatus Uhrbacteria bacterium]
MKAGKGTPSTSRYLALREIRNDTVLMKDGTLRAVLLISSINFFLKSDDEQKGVIQSYTSFLNAFDYPVQIVIQSRQFDPSKYIAELQKLEAAQTNDLLKLQMADYRQFIGELVSLGDIMDKKFFLVIPYDPAGDTKRGFFARVGSMFSAPADILLGQEQFMERKHFLDQRVDNVTAGLLGMGLNAVRLDTQSLIEVFYNLYNPDTSPQEKMVEVNKLQVEDTF